MSNCNNNKKVYVLAEDVRIFRLSEEEIYFRKGIWNFIEANLNLRGQPDSVKLFFNLFASQLLNSGKANIEDIFLEVRVTKDIENKILEVLDSLRTQGYLFIESEDNSWRVVNNMLGALIFKPGETINLNKNILFVTDSDFCRMSFKLLVEQMGINSHYLSDEMVDEITNSNLTLRTSGVEINEKLEKFRKYFKDYSCVICVMQKPNLLFLRNLNRIIIEYNIPFSMGLVDGPFLHVLTIIPLETGCFECFEQRLLARLQDQYFYQKYVSAINKGEKIDINFNALAPYLYLLISFTVSEAYLLSYVDVGKLVGRVLSIYIPTYEIQVQDLLRVPYCPACGFEAISKTEDLYTSFRNILKSKVLNNIEIQGG